MRQFFQIVAVTFGLFGLTGLAGCGDKQAGTPDGKANTAAKGGKTAAHHEHCEEGPHGGQLIELGGKYHAEVVGDEKGHTVTVHLLDAAARGAVAVKQPEIVINAMIDGKSTQHRLMAKPQSSDAEGESSQFVLADEVLFDALFEHEDAKGRLNVQIGGQQFVGQIEHCELKHDHEGHEHEHDHKHDQK